MQSPGVQARRAPPISARPAPRAGCKGGEWGAAHGRDLVVARAGTRGDCFGEMQPLREGLQLADAHQTLQTRRGGRRPYGAAGTDLQ